MGRATHVAEIRGDEGSGPPLVYVPGIDGSGELLLGTAARLEEHFRLLRLCYRVHGPPPPEGDTYEGLAESVFECLDEAGIDRALFLAESFGGAVAFRCAVDRPERVTGLAIVNSFVHYRPTLRLAFSRAVLRVAPNALYRLGRRLFAPLVLLAPRRDPEAIREFRRAPLLDLEEGYLRRMEMISRVDLRAELGRVRLPVALFASTHDRVVDSVETARRMAVRLPDVEVTTIERAGHVVLPLAAEPWVDRLQALAARCTLPSA